MPFWAYYMLVCAALILLGWRGDKWQAPALILMGLLGVRVTALLPEVYNEVGSATVWLIVTALALYYKHYIASVLLGISTIVYLPLVVVGFRIEYMGLLPVVSDLFLILAIGACGGGILGKHICSHRRLNRRSDMVEAFQGGLSQGDSRTSETIGKG